MSQPTSPGTPAPPRAAVRARIYCKLTDHHGPQPLYTALVTKARRDGILGATVLRAIEGYGAHDAFRTSTDAVDLASADPLVVELVDAGEKIDAFLAAIADWDAVGFVTCEAVTIVAHGATR